MKNVMIVLAALSCSCSTLMDSLPSNYNPTLPPRCTATKGFAVWDGVIAGSSTVSAMRQFIAIEDRDPGEASVPNSTYAFMLGSMAFAAAYIFDTMLANRAANQCRAARNNYDEAIMHERFLAETTELRAKRKSVRPTKPRLKILHTASKADIVEAAIPQNGATSYRYILEINPGSLLVLSYVLDEHSTVVDSRVTIEWEGEPLKLVDVLVDGRPLSLALRNNRTRMSAKFFRETFAEADDVVVAMPGKSKRRLRSEAALQLRTFALRLPE